jgi:hypothetical protein
MPERLELAVDLMTRFAERTGVTSGGAERRYLWTDAFAVCNFLGLATATGDGRHAASARRLIERVHAVLGRHRGDDGRAGWLSGLDDRAGEAQPTRGGLRIGKPLPERRIREAFDERLEWDRDGQYFHYLTKWMHALDQAARATAQASFNVWARELAAAAHRAFVHVPPDGGGPRMYWKMSIDLTRPLVASMGQHDPVDGLVTCAELAATAAALRAADAGPDVATLVPDFAAMVAPDRLPTVDPLGLGGLLVDAHRITQLARRGAWPGDDGLVVALLAAAAAGLRHYVLQPDLRAPAAHRLGFRELGLAIGLAAVERLAADGGLSSVVRDTLGRLAPYAPLRSGIEAFWLVDAHRRQPTWVEHEDINDVMLATALLPDGLLELRMPAAAPSSPFCGPPGQG